MTTDTSSPFVITIGRLSGTGGRQFGRELATRLGIAYYDKDILSRAAADTGLGPNVFHHNNDKRGFLRQLVGAVQPFIGGGDFYGGGLTEENAFTLQSGVIKKLAADHSCVIVGRAADYILAEHPRISRIFLTANTEDRIRRVMDEKKVDFKTARHAMQRVDERRASYYNFHTSGTWGNAENYDLCLNLSTLGTNESLEFALQVLSQQLQVTLESAPTPTVPEVF